MKSGATVKYATEENKTAEYELDTEVVYSGRVYALDTIFIGGTTSTSVDAITLTRYTPFFSYYLFEAGIQLEGLEIVYQHLCSHTSTVSGYQYQLLTGTDKYYDRIGIVYKGGTKK